MSILLTEYTNHKKLLTSASMVVTIVSGVKVVAYYTTDILVFKYIFIQA